MRSDENIAFCYLHVGHVVRIECDHLEIFGKYISNTPMKVFMNPGVHVNYSTFNTIQPITFKNTLEK